MGCTIDKGMAPSKNKELKAKLEHKLYLVMYNLIYYSIIIVYFVILCILTRQFVHKMYSFDEFIAEISKEV